jgi:hypothetical protein
MTDRSAQAACNEMVCREADGISGGREARSMTCLDFECPGFKKDPFGSGPDGDDDLQARIGLRKGGESAVGKR